MRSLSILFSCTLVSQQSIYSITRHPGSQVTVMAQKDENVVSAEVDSDAEEGGKEGGVGKY